MDNINGSNIEPIFIIGTPRSGTTLTANILNQHSKIFMPGETHFFDDIYFRRNEFGDPANSKNRSIIIEKLANLYDRYYEPNDQARINTLIDNGTFKRALNTYGTSYKNLFTSFMLIQMQTVGKCRWGNNTPRDIFNIDQIIEFYPKAKIIVCVRDIRAFLLSYKGKWRVTGDSHKTRLQKLYHPVITSILWKASMRNLQHVANLVSSNNLMIVKYEELVTNPKKIIIDICEMIEEKFEEEMLLIDTNNSSSSNSKSGIFTSSLETWRSKLSAEEIFIAQKIARTEMQNLGYHIERVDLNWFLLLSYFLSTPWSLFQALQANKSLYSSPIPFLFRRISALVKNTSK